jgi:hypothetical protein
MPVPTVRLPTVSRAVFLDAVAASGVGPSARELARLAPDLPADAPAAAHKLVVAGALTRFQADRLLTGRAGGLTLGPYTILEPLGAADGGRLLKARHRVMDRLVCVWLPDPGADPAAVRGRLAAARRAARLAHPHILSVLDVGDSGGRPFVVSEYVDGAGLDAILRLAGKFAPGRACDLVRQVALAVAFAHDRRQVHGRLVAEWVRVGRPGGGGDDGRMAVKVDGFAGTLITAATEAADRAAVGDLLAALLGKREAADPAVLALADELGTGRVPAAEAAARLQALADPDGDRPRFDLPPASVPSGVLSGGRPDDGCPFAGLSSDEIRLPARGHRHLWAVAAVAAAVSGAVLLVVATLV